MKKFICFMLILGLVIPVVFAGGSGDKGGNKGVTGKIIIYTSMYEDVIQSVEKDLQKQFPKCNIEFVYRGTGTHQAKIAAEMAENKLGCDILLVAEPAYSLELKEKGILHSYKSKEASSLAFDYDPEGYWYPVRISKMVLAYNPEKNNKNSIPNTFRDFAYDARVRGAISMSNPLVSGTTMATVTALRDKYGYEYFEALNRQGVTIDSGSVAMTKLENGAYKVIMILEESVLKMRQEGNSKLEVIYPDDGTVVIPSTIMIINSKWSANSNIKAAEAITDWFLGHEGQSAIVAGWMHSVRADSARLPYDAVPSVENMPVNWENCFRQRDEIQAKFEEIVIDKR